MTETTRSGGASRHNVTLDEGYELVKVCDSPFDSLPLFLPADATYDPATNTATKPHDAGETNTAQAKTESGTMDLHRLVKVPNAGWDMLESLEAPVSIISCIGPYRTGKSLLTSRFLNTSNTFRVGPTLEGCTVGIWISTSALKDSKTGCYKLLLDVEGLGDPLAGDEASNARMALACLLLSSVVLFNNTSHPDRGSLQFLKCLSTIRRRIHTNNNDNAHRHCFPSFVWVFRDFFLQLPARRDTGKPYTLQEFMMERVLQPTTTSTHGDAVESEVVDSLLNDFETLQVLKVSHPKRKGQHPLSPEEMAHLGDLDWEELDESFRTDIQQVISTSLELAKPFELGRTNNGASTNGTKKKWGIFGRNHKQDQYARGKAYAKWCETVLELVNSSGVIPNLPDLQQQLVQQMADAQLVECVQMFETELERFWNSCSVYNENDTATADLVIHNDLHAVAEEAELHCRAQEIFTQQKELLSKSGNITSSSVLQTTLEQLESRCVATTENKSGGASTPSTPVVSIYARIRLANAGRSQRACEILADYLYKPVQESVRNDPTCMTLEEFRNVVAKLQASYRLQARGPVKDTVLSNNLVQPSEADALFVAKVTEKHDALQDSLSKQASLFRDIEQKEAQLNALNADLEHVRAETQRELQALTQAHENALQQALAEQQRLGQEQREQLRTAMEQQLQEAQARAERDRKASEAQLQEAQAQAEQRLQAEVQAREERLRQEKELFDQQMEMLKETANADLKAKLDQVQAASRQEQERLEQEMTQRIEESESRLQEEIRVKEMALAQTQKDLEESKLAKKEMQERLDRYPCPDRCVTM